MSTGIYNTVLGNLITTGYNRASNNVSKILEDLSSGIKLNSADDNAIDTVISKKIKNITDATNTSIKNIQTVNSALNITEGSMSGISDIISKIHNLTLDATNGTQDYESVVAIINEIIDRLQEIDRLAQNTNFQGKNLLDGSIKSFPIQINGENDEEFCLDIKDVFKDCSTKALDIKLPDNLNPKSEDYKPIKDNFHQYLEKLSKAINEVSKNRGTIGSYQKRLESMYDLAQKKQTELESINSSISDTNIATSASDYISNQILEQLNVSLFMSSNDIQKNILGLLS